LQTTFIYVTHDQTEAMTMGSRIVVMKDGFMQQQDTPQNLYDYPANLFVACFIGTPQMNIFRVKLESQNGAVYAKFGDNCIKVPEGKVKLMNGDYIGKEVYMGIRPENIDDSEATLSTYPDACIDVNVELIELMGSETYLYLKTSGKEENFVARVDPRSTSRGGDKIKVAFDVNRLHFFDVETEKTILDRD
ncbi:MAG: TOBE domain-containing protein, partial [Clostridia bacterium]|nr:TOBE domain-containing protein [Clostridia bacterium]